MSTNLKKIDGSLTAARNRIKAFPASVTDSYVKTIWETLRVAIIEILKKNNSGLSYEELYRNAYTMVLQKHGEQLYNNTKQVITEHLTKIKDDITKNINNNFLSYLNLCWTDHHVAMTMIRDILLYLDRVYVMQYEKENVYNVGLIIFRDIVLRFSTIQKNLKNNLLNIVAKERKGEPVVKTQIRDACQMLVQLGINSTSIYEEFFEKSFLEQSKEFYHHESEKLISGNILCIDYINKVEQRIDEESKRARYFLDPSTELKVVRVLEEELITKHIESIVNMQKSGLHHMLQKKEYKNINSMFRLLSRVNNGLQVMSQCISSFLREEGKLISSNESITPSNYISDLLKLRDRATALLSEALDNHSIFRNQINSDFEWFIKINSRSPEYLSIFIDEKLRHGTKGLNDSELDAVFDKCIVLFRYLQDKDVFERYYTEHLAKRLLMMKSQSDDLEKNMITKLIAECGRVFTSKLEGMFKDMAISKTLMDEWSNNAQIRNSVSVDLNVRILTTGLWPTQTINTTIILPDEAKLGFDVYSKFYLSKHNGRVINLQPTLGCVELTGEFYGTPNGVNNGIVTKSTNDDKIQADISPSHDSSGSINSQISQTCGDASHCNKREPTEVIATNTGAITTKKYIFQVSTYQMIILMLFNHKNKITYKEILEKSNIPELDLQKNLLAITMSKASQKLLIKEPKSKSPDLLTTDIFSVNEAFYSKHNRVKVQSISIKETEPERIETKSRVDENRKYVVEAAIVRIMKTRKTLSHNLLITEVTEQLKARFLPNPQMIKQRIDSLLERDYLARSTEDRTIYTYLA